MYGFARSCEERQEKSEQVPMNIKKKLQHFISETYYNAAVQYCYQPSYQVLIFNTLCCLTSNTSRNDSVAGSEMKDKVSIRWYNLQKNTIAIDVEKISLRHRHDHAVSTVCCLNSLFYVIISSQLSP